LLISKRFAGQESYGAFSLRSESFIHLRAGWRAPTDDRKVAWEIKTARQPASFATLLILPGPPGCSGVSRNTQFFTQIFQPREHLKSAPLRLVLFPPQTPALVISALFNADECLADT